jgi:hypothetical protein
VSHMPSLTQPDSPPGSATNPIVDDDLDVVEARAILMRYTNRQNYSAINKAIQAFIARLLQLDDGKAFTVEEPLRSSTTQHTLVVIRRGHWFAHVRHEDGEYRLTVFDPNDLPNPIKVNLEIEFDGEAIRGTEIDETIVVPAGARRPKKGAVVVTIQTFVDAIETRSKKHT